MFVSPIMGVIVAVFSLTMGVIVIIVPLLVVMVKITSLIKDSLASLLGVLMTAASMIGGLIALGVLMRAVSHIMGVIASTLGVLVAVVSKIMLDASVIKTVLSCIVKNKTLTTHMVGILLQ